MGLFRFSIPKIIGKRIKACLFFGGEMKMPQVALQRLRSFFASFIPQSPTVVIVINWMTFTVTKL